MSFFRYNMIELPYCYSKSVEYTPATDETGTDYIGTDLNISINAIITPGVAPWIMGERPSDTIRRIEHELMQPRKSLYFTADEDITHPIVNIPDGIDLNNGPTPVRCLVDRFDGGEVLHVSFSIRTRILNCATGTTTLTGGGARPATAWLSNKWTETVSINASGYSRKSRAGMIVTRSDMYTNPDALRDLVVPSLSRGFRRESAEYVIQSNGLALRYTVVDEEVYEQPPEGTTVASGEYIESTQDGALRQGACNVTLEAGKNFPKRNLLATAILVVMTRLDQAGIQRSRAGRFAARSSVAEDLYNNKVTVRIATTLAPLTRNASGAPIDLTKWGASPAASSEVGPAIGNRGSAGLRLIAAALRDPCLMQSAQQEYIGGSSTPRQPVTNDRTTDTNLRPGTPPADVRTVPRLPTTTTLTPGTDDTIYTTYMIKDQLDTDENKLALAPLDDESATAEIAVIRMGKSFQRRTITFYAERLGAWPDLPDCSINDGNHELMYTSVVVQNATPTAGGLVSRFSRAGFYTYVLRRRLTGNTLMGGRVPPGVLAPNVLRGGGVNNAGNVNDALIQQGGGAGNGNAAIPPNAQ